MKGSVSCLSVGQVNTYCVNQGASLAYKNRLFPIKLLKVLDKSLNSELLVLKHTLVCAAMELLLWVSAGFTLFINDFSVSPNNKGLLGKKKNSNKFYRAKYTKCSETFWKKKVPILQ